MNIKHIILLLLIVVLTACSENDGIESRQTMPSDTNTIEDLVPVEFSVSDQRTIDFTRAATSIITFTAGEAVKVFVKPDGAASYTGYDYTTVSGLQSTSLTPPATPPYYPAGTGTTVEAYAYYPSTASSSFSVQSDQTSDADYKASDLMYAENRIVTKGSSNGNDHLLMQHQMAQLAITAQPQTASGLTITRVEVSAQMSVTFAPNTANIVTTTGGAGTITALNAAGTGYIVIPPQAINGVTIKVITGSGTDDEIATYTFTGAGNFESGNSYGIDLTISPDQLGLTTSINNWNGVGSVNVTPSGNLTISAINAQKYTGSAIEPSFSVYRDGALFDPANYDTRWVNNIESGTAYVIVTGKNLGTGADYSTCIGMASFVITPAYGKLKYDVTSKTETYGATPFTNPLTNYDKRSDSDHPEYNPIYVGRVADGLVAYSSSDPTVATVDAATGEVTMLKAGITTITATATNGANYVYDPGDNTASYVLTVNKAAGSISFGYSTPSQTWSATTANNTYTQTVTHTGDATITYSIGGTNTCEATINPSTGEVAFTKSGSVQVIASVSGDTERFSYASQTATYTLTVNKATGFVTISPTSGSVDAGNSTSFTVLTSHGGTLSAADISGNNRTGTLTISGSTVTVPTNGVGASSATIRLTCDANDYYNTAYTDYELTINAAVDIEMNPLWYVAEYNLASNGSFETANNAGYYFTWGSAMNYAAQSSSYNVYKTASKGPNNMWHLPIEKEWFSIVPGENNTYIETFDSGSGTYKNAYIQPVWGYNSTTKNPGILESSYWKRKSATELHAIRFLGTEYCSAWKYEWIGSFTSSNYGYLKISATLIGNIEDSQAAASTWYTNNFGTVYWGNDDSKGAAQRIFYALGYRINGNGDGTTPQLYQGEYGYGWSATERPANDTRAWAMVFTNGRAAIHSSSFAKGYAWAVRLFRDH